MMIIGNMEVQEHLNSNRTARTFEGLVVWIKFKCFVSAPCVHSLVLVHSFFHSFVRSCSRSLERTWLGWFACYSQTKCMRDAQWGWAGRSPESEGSSLGNPCHLLFTIWSFELKEWSQQRWRTKIAWRMIINKGIKHSDNDYDRLGSGTDLTNSTPAVKSTPAIVVAIKKD